MNEFLALLMEPITAEQTEVPFVGQIDLALPAQAMFVNVRTGEFEVVTLDEAVDGRMVFTRENPRAWTSSTVLASYDPQIEGPQAGRVVGNLRREAWKNARI